VIYHIYDLVKILFSFIREKLLSVPEDIKRLRFPLKHNPNMKRESIWAHIIAIEVKSGVMEPDGYTLAERLNEINHYYPTFDYDFALDHLSKLNVIDSKSISDAKKQIKMKVDFSSIETAEDVINTLSKIK